MKACVIGAGAWGTVLGIVLHDNGYEVVLWDRSRDTVESLRRERMVPRLFGVVLPREMAATVSIQDALDGASIVVSAIPSTALRDVAVSFAPIIPAEAIIVSATKGLDPLTLQRPTEVWREVEPSLGERLVALSGPNFAQEIARKLPAATVVAGENQTACRIAQSAFMVPYLRVYTHYDVTGVELGGALKNVIAIACGMVEGLGLGYNAQAGIISRGLAEMTRLGVALGADPLTFSGLSGLGDLVLTATGHLSRNRQAGIAVARGEPIESFLARTGYTVEGLATVRSAMALARRHRVSMPITEVVYRILYENLPVQDGLYLIMSREKRPEHE